MSDRGGNLTAGFGLAVLRACGTQVFWNGSLGCLDGLLIFRYVQYEG